ncbi:auxin efflux carrier component 5-like [Chenopodium quinoa]|uniref:Auxin efflux carrier component n=1 Tax=Chenopodium quinoa TaxID=63459 RepID=A0A803L479_CHEQI|nr:auxin efflux carrier component 5-like [Chenopodium quinoa]
MISLDDIYKVIVATVPLYVALILGYGSVKWWHLFKPDQVDAINRLVCYFTLPLFNLDFTAHSNPFKWNYKFLAADGISKVIIVAVLALWARCSSKGSYCWSITNFSLCTLTSSLVVGVPLLGAMYGQLGIDLVVQFSVIQAIVWLTVLLLVLEFRQSRSDFPSTMNCSTSVVRNPPQVHSLESSRNDLEGKVINIDGLGDDNRPSLWCLMKVVGKKLLANPNSYSCIVGIVWALFACRFNFQIPSIVDGSILIMSKAGTGTSMFSMGMFMALQEKLIACGPKLTMFGMILKFVAGPAAMAIAALVVGLHGDVLRIAIIQAALPQSITSFIYAKEYGLHADVLSTAVIFGMMASLPILIAYYAILQTLHSL